MLNVLVNPLWRIGPVFFFSFRVKTHLELPDLKILIVLDAVGRDRTDCRERIAKKWKIKS